MTNLPKIALGAWAWGNDGTFCGSLTAETLRPIFDKAMENGLNLWDTAYAYGVGIAQVPVAWAIAKGTLPIIGVTKVSHVEDAVKAANITLTADEVRELESVADGLGLNVIRFWEKEMK